MPNTLDICPLFHKNFQTTDAIIVQLLNTEGYKCKVGKIHGQENVCSDSSPLIRLI